MKSAVEANKLPELRLGRQINLIYPMTSSDPWTCDGMSKDGKPYANLQPQRHRPEINYGAECGICGLPREAMNQAKGGSGLFKKSILIAAAIGGIIFVGGGIAYNSSSQSCDLGFQKIDDQCVDIYRQTYQESKQRGDEAVNLANNYQSIKDLEQAQLSLDAVFTQLSQIPSDATIFSEAQSQLQLYQSEPAKIDTNLQKETKVQIEFEAAIAIAIEASSQSTKANSISQLQNAKQKWQTAQDKLKAIAPHSLLTIQIEQLQSEYGNKISDLDRRIADIVRQSRPVTRSTPARVKPKYRPKPVTEPKYRPKPVAKPTDPCAVPNPPPNCLF